jgi:hypothetical protein
VGNQGTNLVRIGWFFVAKEVKDLTKNTKGLYFYIWLAKQFTEGQSQPFSPFICADIFDSNRFIYFLGQSVFSQNKLESFIKGTQCTNQYGVKVNLY